jgi:hypothetical protein
MVKVSRRRAMIIEASADALSVEGSLALEDAGSKARLICAIAEKQCAHNPDFRGFFEHGGGCGASQHSL